MKINPTSIRIRTSSLMALLALAILGGFSPQALAHKLGDFVWNDLNKNGIQDPGEPGVNGVVVKAYNCSDNTLAEVDDGGNPLLGNPQLTHNDGVNNGAYQFTFRTINPEVYLVFEAPAGFEFTARNQGSDDEKDSDVDPATGRTECIELHCFGAGDPACIQLQWDAGLVPVSNPGTGTPGYWKNHAAAWPVSNITIGGITYTKKQAIALMGKPDGDKTYTMFRALVSAKLNVLIGNASSCIATTIADADLWMQLFGPAGAGVKASSLAWKLGEPLYQTLDAYNNGLLCAPSRG